MATSEGALNYAGVQVGQVEGEEAEESTFTAMTLHSEFHTPWGKLYQLSSLHSRDTAAYHA